MSDEIDRRPLLKAIGATLGAGATVALLPKTWTRPVVEAVVVPAHAAASPVTTTTTTTTTTTAAPGTSGLP